MTTVQDLRTRHLEIVEDQRRLLPPRLIGVGVRDHVHDSATLAWAMADAVIGADAVHVVHSYLPLRLDGCAWEPVSRARDARYLAGKRSVAQAVARSATSHRELRIAGSAIAGLPEDVLEELTSVVDVLVVGDDSGGPVRSRRIAWHVQDVALCPVVCVPHGYRGGDRLRPVTVVEGERGFCEPAMAFGVEAAIRQGTSLQVSRTWASLHGAAAPSSAWLAHQQEELDTQLSDWRQRHPQLPIVARIELGPGWLSRLRSTSSLVVTGSGSAPSVRSTGPLPDHACPTVVVPEHSD